MTRYCTECDNGTELVHERRDVIYAYKGRSTIIKDLSGWHCPVCGNGEFDETNGEAERYSVAIHSLIAAVDAEQAAAVRAIRKRLKLSQKEAGDLFGGGVNAFSQYELGKTQPHKSTVLLLRLLDKHPELLNELR